MQGFFLLVDAVNRAGSTEPASIQKALQQTDIKPEQLMMGYKGVKFDQHGQNILAASYLIQSQGNQYKSVWPEQNATMKLELSYKGWSCWSAPSTRCSRRG